MSYKSFKIILFSLIWLLFFFYFAPLVWPLSWFTPDTKNAETIFPEWYFKANVSDSSFEDNFPFPVNKLSKLPAVLATPQSLYFISFNKARINTIKKDKKYLYSPSLYGSGYIRYQKYDPNMKLEFFSPHGRKYWESDEHAYPVLGSTGKLGILLSSNNYKCSIIDKDGKILNHFEGPFLIDIAFSANQKFSKLNSSEIDNQIKNPIEKAAISEHVAFAFMGGILYLVNEKGKAIYKRNQEKTIYKSLALSPNAQYILLHGKKGEGNDYFELINTLSADSEFIQSIPGIIPHKVYMAVNNSGTVLIQYINRTLLLDSSGDLIARFEPQSKTGAIEEPFSIKKNYVHSENGIYNPIAATKNLLLFGRGENAYLINNDGRIIHIFHKKSNSPWRFHFSADSKVLVIEDGLSLRYYSIKEY